MAKTKDTLCACGCQQVVTPGRTWKHGHRVRMQLPLVERFWAKVRKTETCWLWTGATTLAGYGKMKRGPRQSFVQTHRLSFELHYGPILPGILVLHRCDNPSCVRPDHLFLGTHEDNMRDMLSKGHGRWQRHPDQSAKGTSNGRAKLTDDQVKAIRQSSLTGHVTTEILAQIYGVHVSSIQRIRARTSWTHVDD